MNSEPQRRRAARRATGEGSAAARRTPITVRRITDAALEIVAARGYDALTMRNVAAELGTGPASLYAHVVNKADLDELIISRLCSEIDLPEVDPTRWQEQITDVCTQLRDQYLKYPGISRAALAMDVTDLDILRLNEGMLSILLAGGISPQPAAWTADALFLYVGAYTLDSAAARPGSDASDWRHSATDRNALIDRFAALPIDRFPHIRDHAAELASGTDHERFDFTLRLLLGHPA